VKPGDRVIWLRSPGRSIITRWRVERIPGVIVRICPRRLRIRVSRGECEKVVSVDPENLLPEETDTPLIRP
jgi:hypothetical protein